MRVGLGEAPHQLARRRVERHHVAPLAADRDQHAVDVAGCRAGRATAKATGVPYPRDFQVFEVRRGDLVGRREPRVPGVAAQIGPLSRFGSRSLGHRGLLHPHQGHQEEQGEYRGGRPSSVGLHLSAPGPGSALSHQRLVRSAMVSATSIGRNTDGLRDAVQPSPSMSTRISSGVRIATKD